MYHYLAWVLFVLGTVNVVATTARYIRKEEPTFSDGFCEGLWSIVRLLVFAGFLYGWWVLK